MIIITIVCHTVSVTTGAPPAADPCGSVLSLVPSLVLRAPEGWVLCHLTNPQGNLEDTPCEDLLVALRGSLNAERLLESGNTVDVLTF